MIYEQTLVKTLKDYIKPHTLKRENRYKKWEYGYNKDHDMVIISKTGKIGEVYEIQGLKIALPLVENSYKKSSSKLEQRWEHLEYPKELSKIKSVFDWEDRSSEFKNKWYDYID